jgi:hypothetical protein
MLGPELVPLSRSFRERKDEPTTDFIKEYLMCPALTDTMKDTFVIPSPLDLHFNRDEKGELNVQAGGPLANQDFFWNKTYTTTGQSENSLQFLSDHFISVFADKPTILELTPPYMHSSKLYGFAGRYDIHSWLRPLSFVLETAESVYIKRGEPLAYLRFITDHKIKIVYVDTDDRFQHIIDRCTRYKGIKEKSSLRELYNVFNSSRQKAKLLKLLRELSE